ncbi:HAD-IIA family hydrolase [Humidisolicoccus flavus]|uniref:HAD-IIA family hydrolase n=1 Tax=Humidisolicoccus flavus TaxID=3111414 RepID=UPI003255B13A
MSSSTPLTGVDLVMADLDGVVYQGPAAIPHAVDALAKVQVPLAYITNNASRTANSVAEHLSSFGLHVAAHEVVTSPQAAMRLLAPHLEPGDPVLVVGGEGLTSEVEKAGWRVVRAAADQPKAVVQGFAPDVGWTQLAEASFALHTGIPWIATNTDWTIPVAGGIAPGNGTLVSAVHTAVGRFPEVGGKPEQPIFTVAQERFSAQNPLMIGDRLDTDILGAQRAGIRSAIVLTGIDQAKQLLAADKTMRPDFILEDLRELHEEYPETRETFERSTGHRYFEVGTAAVQLTEDSVNVLREGAGIDTLRAGCAAIWSSGRSIHSLKVASSLYE